MRFSRSTRRSLTDQPLRRLPIPPEYLPYSLKLIGTAVVGIEISASGILSAFRTIRGRWASAVKVQRAWYPADNGQALLGPGPSATSVSCVSGAREDTATMAIKRDLIESVTRGRLFDETRRTPE